MAKRIKRPTKEQKKKQGKEKVSKYQDRVKKRGYRRRAGA
jgi:hypothetical protein